MFYYHSSEDLVCFFSVKKLTRTITKVSRQEDLSVFPSQEARRPQSCNSITFQIELSQRGTPRQLSYETRCSVGPPCFLISDRIAAESNAEARGFSTTTSSTRAIGICRHGPQTACRSEAAGPCVSPCRPTFSTEDSSTCEYCEVYRDSTAHDCDSTLMWSSGVADEYAITTQVV